MLIYRKGEYIQWQTCQSGFLLGPLFTCVSTIQRSVKHEWSLIITHSFHVKITLQYCFSSEKENGDTQAINLSLS